MAAGLECELAPKGIGLEGTVWENYRLRGTQVDFVDSTGKPTLLANSHIESDFQTTASCISCHARATIGPPIPGVASVNRLSIFDPPYQIDQQIITPSGAPDSSMFVSYLGATGSAKPVLRYTQLDFVWSLFRAH